MTKISFRRGNSLTTSGPQNMDSCLVLTECLKSSDSVFTNITDRLFPLRNSVERYLFCQSSGIRFKCTNDSVSMIIWTFAKIPFSFKDRNKTSCRKTREYTLVNKWGQGKVSGVVSDPQNLHANL